MLLFNRHKWTILEDIMVCTFAKERETDPKSISKLAKRLGIEESKVAYRLSNYSKLFTGSQPDWHYSAQEKKVFDFVANNKLIRFKTI